MRLFNVRVDCALHKQFGFLKLFLWFYNVLHDVFSVVFMIRLYSSLLCFCGACKAACSCFFVFLFVFCVFLPGLYHLQWLSRNSRGSNLASLQKIGRRRVGRVADAKVLLLGWNHRETIFFESNHITLCLLYIVVRGPAIVNSLVSFCWRKQAFAMGAGSPNYLAGVEIPSSLQGISRNTSRQTVHHPKRNQTPHEKTSKNTLIKGFRSFPPKTSRNINENKTSCQLFTHPPNQPNQPTKPTNPATKTKTHQCTKPTKPTEPTKPTHQNNQPKPRPTKPTEPTKTNGTNQNPPASLPTTQPPPSFPLSA